MKKYARRQSKHSRKESQRNSHSVPEMVAISSIDHAELHEELEEEDAVDSSSSSSSSHVMRVKVKLWEFGQNDPKKDSGSRLCKLHFAVSMRIGQPFNGIVLSSETKTFISSVDASLAEQYGVAGINCSWNRLKEIPFQSLGRDRNQRILPFLLAANSINYGRPFKLNTAEAIAAALYIMGFKEDAYYLLSSFNYGAEFFRMNAVELELYSRCLSSVEVEAANDQVMMRLEAKKDEKERRREEERRGCGISTSYLGEMDLPPDFDEEEEYEEEEKLEKEKSVVGPPYSEEEPSTARCD